MQSLLNVLPPRNHLHQCKQTFHKGQRTNRWRVDIYTKKGYFTIFSESYAMKNRHHWSTTLGVGHGFFFVFQPRETHQQETRVKSTEYIQRFCDAGEQTLQCTRLKGKNKNMQEESSEKKDSWIFFEPLSGEKHGILREKKNWSKKNVALRYTTHHKQDEKS